MGDVVEFLLYGAAIGLSLGLTGGGGSIIAVPLLVYALGVPVHTAIGTALAVVGGIALQGALRQRERVQWRVGIVLAAWGLAGSLAGSLAAAHVPGRWLMFAFAMVMVCAAATMFARPSLERDASAPPSPETIILTGIGVGALTGFLGVGGGFLIVPALVLALGMPMREAIATSLFVIFLNALASIVARSAYAGIDWHLAVLFLAGGFAGNALGAALAAHLNARRLKMVFAGFVLMVGMFTTASATGVINVAVR